MEPTKHPEPRTKHPEPLDSAVWVFPNSEHAAGQNGLHLQSACQLYQFVALRAWIEPHFRYSFLGHFRHDFLSDLRRHVEAGAVVDEDQGRPLGRVALSAEAEVERAVAALIEASKEVKVIEKHRETWRQRTLREEQLREQKIGDEIGAVTYRRNRGQ